MHTYTIGQNEVQQIVIDRSGTYIVELVGKGARAEILGALVARGDEKLAVSVTTIHRARDTSSDAFLRAVARDRASVWLTGLVKIENSAQRTNAFLSEQVLMLSNEARAHAIPNLEIEADDVRASHAATVGAVDGEQLFYLMSRGLEREEAEQLIVDGFLDAVRQRMTKNARRKTNKES